MCKSQSPSKCRKCGQKFANVASKENHERFSCKEK